MLLCRMTTPRGSRVEPEVYCKNATSSGDTSADESMRFIQFWILPSVRGLATSVQQQQFTIEDRTDRWLQIMGPAGTDGLDLSSDARALVAHLTDAGRLEHGFG